MVSEKSTNSQFPEGTREFKLTDLIIDREGLILTGNPKIITSPYGNAIWFDGIDDGIFLSGNPLKDLSSFTVELLIKPDFKGPVEQRFLHIGEIDGDRLLVETRSTPDGQWYLDTFIQSGQSKTTLIDPKLVHPIGKWYHIAFALDKEGYMRNYVNGKFELEGHVDFKPVNSGEMSIGVRRNKVSWYKGAIYKIKISPEVLVPEAFFSF